MLKAPRAEFVAAEGLIPIHMHLRIPGYTAARHAPQGQMALCAVRKTAGGDGRHRQPRFPVRQGAKSSAGCRFEPQAEKTFTFDLAIPDGWQVTELKHAAAGQPVTLRLQWEKTGRSA